jgi:hypothetical protein
LGSQAPLAVESSDNVAKQNVLISQKPPLTTAVFLCFFDLKL